MDKNIWCTRRYIKLPLILTLLSLFATSCTEPYAMWQVILGNYRYEQGRYHEATMHYFETLSLDYQEEIVYFNLGSLYHALGEAEAAQEMWIQAQNHQSVIIQSQAHYNRGVVYYQLGEYAHAIEHFQYALLLHRQDMNAKINLELAQIALFRQEEAKQPATRIPPSPVNQRQLDYLKRRNTLFLGVESQEPEWLDPDDI
ncbi:tetratricopeptide repeat protein [Entomospira entomophila]|uniref:Tetratricopeptide repeat protein n=1 Tax=Entomospira entomophila TaxID=2719988 RepID=A0A968G8U3_9SPIO|nr:tetratricopeptide repeat protein [Entomospira entomophilus]NIZ40698.1 tetratricopeptide repeat protein [Entomospira entomophilus]WDI34911.1 tetratricopeptide repeat protein [Entomospira entomophilus]